MLMLTRVYRQYNDSGSHHFRSTYTWYSNFYAGGRP